MSTLQEDPELTRDLHRVFTRLYEKAQVQLSASEKGVLVDEIGKQIAKNAAVVAWV